MQSGKSLSARIEIDITRDKGPEHKVLVARHGQVLFDPSNEREAYKSYMMARL
jgi:hypothetical protein